MRIQLDPHGPTSALADIQAILVRYPGTSTVTLDVEWDGAESHLTLGPAWNVLCTDELVEELRALKAILDVRRQSGDCVHDYLGTCDGCS